MRIFSAALVSIAMLAGSASARAHENAENSLAPFFGNTWVYTAGDGTKYVYLNADQSFAIVVQDGDIYRGRWTMEDQKVCFHVGSSNPSCFTDLMGRKVGLAWKGVPRPEQGPYAGIIHEGRPKVIAQGNE